MLQKLRSPRVLMWTRCFRRINLEAMSGTCLLGPGVWRQSSWLGPFAKCRCAMMRVCPRLAQVKMGREIRKILEQSWKKRERKGELATALQAQTCLTGNMVNWYNSVSICWGHEECVGREGIQGKWETRAIDHRTWTLHSFIQRDPFTTVTLPCCIGANKQNKEENVNLTTLQG